MSRDKDNIITVKLDVVNMREDAKFELQKIAGGRGVTLNRLMNIMIRNSLSQHRRRNRVEAESAEAPY